MVQKIEFIAAGNVYESNMACFSLEGEGTMFGPSTRYIVGQATSGHEILIMTREIACINRDQFKDDTIIEEFDNNHCFGMLFIDGRPKRSFLVDAGMTTCFEKKAEIYEEELDGKHKVRIIWDPYYGDYENGVDPNEVKVVLADVELK